jgi:hypothetical protein
MYLFASPASMDSTGVKSFRSSIKEMSSWFDVGRG